MSYQPFAPSGTAGSSVRVVTGSVLSTAKTSVEVSKTSGKPLGLIRMRAVRVSGSGRSVSHEYEPFEKSMFAAMTSLKLIPSDANVMSISSAALSDTPLHSIVCVPRHSSPPSGLSRSMVVIVALAVETKKPLRRAAPQRTENILEKAMELRETCKLCISIFDKRITSDRARGRAPLYAFDESCLVDRHARAVSSHEIFLT